jgi:hypothetical protein
MIGINKERNKMKEIEIYKKILNDSEVNFEEGLVKKKKGLSLKPYFQRAIISEEDIKKAKENSEETRRRIFG